MPIVKSNKPAEKHLTSHHGPVFVMQAIIFSVVVMVVSYLVFTGLTTDKQGKKSLVTQQPAQSSQDILTNKKIDENLFQEKADSQIDQSKLENLFPNFKTQ